MVLFLGGASRTRPAQICAELPWLGALVEHQPVSWKIRNPISEHLHNQEKRKFSQFVGDVLGFIAVKYGEIDEKAMDRRLKPDGTELSE